MSIEGIQNAAINISKIANKTPVMTSRTLDNDLDCQIYMKFENFQRGGAFKFRGAYNAISKLSDEEKKKGVIAHSSGNHAQAVALNGKLHGIKTVIVMPENAPQVKVNATRGYNAEVVFSKSTIESREIICNELIQKYGYTMIHPYDNEDVIEGAASTTVELIEEVGELDILICPVGGGGLISGSSKYAKLSGKVKLVIGAEPENANDAYISMKTNKRVEHHIPNTICDGLRTVLSERTFSYIRKYVSEIITVSEEEIIDSMKFVWERMKVIIEPSSAVVLAALKRGLSTGTISKGLKVGLIFSGGNIDINEFFNILKKKLE